MAKKIELLAPAGTYDAFLAAIENGADAVYLGGKLLNARQFAGNFDEEQLERALDYAHTRDAGVFLTMNTLVLDSEMQEAVEYAAKAYEMGIDAFIVQDMGLASNLKKLIPEITLHASTQMTIYSMEGIKALETLGFRRIVLARELNLAEIKRICGQTPLEIEAFVHGALCICVSGQCYMSSMIGGRSGNRGKCAQPCRMPYSIKRDGGDIGSGYLISPKDICYIDHLSDLIDAGVTSLKIEGRMKSPEYVASVVGTYRKYLDLIYEEKGIADSKTSRHKVSQEDRHKLLQSFNRGGFSKGYLLGKTGPEMMAYEKPKNWGTPLGSVVSQDKSTNSVLIKLDNMLGMGDGIEIWSGSKFQESPGGIITKIVKEKKLVRKAHKGDTVWVSVIKGNVQKGSRVYKTSDKEMLEQAAATYSKGSRKSGIKASFTMKYGQVPVLNLQDAYGNSVSAAGEQLPQKAVNKPLTKERIIEQLKKMGSTPFDIEDINLDIDEDAVIPISELNNIRRSAGELLEQKRILSFKKESANFDKRTFNSISYFPGNVQKINKDKKISAMFYDYPDRMDFKDLDVDRVYLTFTEIMGNEKLQSVENIRRAGKEVYAYIPAVIRGNYTEILKKGLQKVSADVDGFLAGSPAVYEIVREKLGNRVPIVGDYTINILNSYSLNKLKELGFTGGTLSCELNLSQITEMKYPQDFDTELVVYGKIPVMTSEYCPVGGSVGKCEPQKCGKLCKNGVYKLSDRKGAEFLVKSDCIDCRSTIFNSNVLFAPELSEQISKTGIEHIRLSFVDETEKDLHDICSLYRSLLRHDKITSNMEKLVERIKVSGFTRGHLQKGV
ncbi:U32 family peptidase [Ruminiclostridium papyrosolvens]|uniref:Peptidase U32 n=1 Tax=Ruminiclostridium papyrosolvens C7 TaxID=1330534 RepID=U4R770_9FIRM|nr:U32 family peptidase [Ruminiclostridium papyrosolvens]EPR14283.1 peptidase U32 [Ruminiclostridium papyrosolvens C7]